MAAGISNPEVVDLVTQDQKTGEFVVIMVHDQPWLDGDEQRDQLLKKVQNYLYFIEGGELFERFPQAVGMPVRIQLDCQEHPRGQVYETINQIQRLLLERGIAFAVNAILSIGSDH